jgi:hypothetical protein
MVLAVANSGEMLTGIGTTFARNSLKRWRTNGPLSDAGIQEVRCLK